MSIKTMLASRIAVRLLSEKALLEKRRREKKKRLANKAKRTIDYFHQVDDPYSHLMLQVLVDLKNQHEVHIAPWLVPPPPDWAAPARKLLVDYSRIDAARLATKLGLEFKDPGCQPDSTLVAAVTAELHQQVDRGSFIGPAFELSQQLWDGTVDISQAAKPASLEVANRRRNELGHYLGATCYFEGEWYWGVDRLHYLQSRLCQEDGQPVKHVFKPPIVPSISGTDLDPAPEIDVFLSFRSPYSYIVLPRLKKLAEQWGAKLRLKFVLPMVMRNLPVPWMKGRYILLDVAREARFYGVPFGRAADPVGDAVERGYSLIPWAMSHDKGYEFCLSFMSNVWSKGVDAGSDQGMERIVIESGLDWREGQTQMGNDNWRAEAEANRQELFDLGLWGVPSYKIGGTAIWGQDRLWLLEDILAQMAPKTEEA